MPFPPTLYGAILYIHFPSWDHSSIHWEIRASAGKAYVGSCVWPNEVWSTGSGEACQDQGDVADGVSYLLLPGLTPEPPHLHTPQVLSALSLCHPMGFYSSTFLAHVIRILSLPPSNFSKAIFYDII